MARRVWRGPHALGLASGEVGRPPAAPDESVHRNRFEAGTVDRTRYRGVIERIGGEVVTAAAAPERPKLVDLTAALDASQMAAGDRRPAARRRSPREAS